jgi:hypothetical protein
MRLHTTPKRGAAALPVALLLLFGMTLIAFFANRGMLFEQRTSANQYRSTIAFEAAEAGLEWYVARLNDPRFISAAPTCYPGATLTSASAGDRLLPLTSSGFTINGAMRVGCSLNAAGTPTCGCPTSGDPTLGSKDDPRFTVRISSVSGDPWSVRIESYGCSNASADGLACDPTSSGSDAVAYVTAVYKMKPAFPNAPGAGLVTGAIAATSGNFSVINTDVASNGITINAGAAVELGSAVNVISLPGTPARASVLDNDPSLANLNTLDPTGDVFFATFFGETLSQYQNNPLTWTLQAGACGSNANCSQCSTASACATSLVNAISNGFYKFWASTDISIQGSDVSGLPGGTLGSASKPIALASSSNIKLTSAMTAYGMFYSQSADVWDYTGSGTVQVNGAFVSRTDFNKGAGTLDLVYNANLFDPGRSRGTMIRVPGSWRDKTSDF